MINDPDYYKNLLLAIYPCRVPFTVVLKEDKPKRRLGTYYGKTCKIVLHTGWATKHDLIEVAIHEYAHHIHYTEFEKARKKNAPHGKEFWQIYGQLMNRAQALGLCSYKQSPVLRFPDSSKVVMPSNGPLPQESDIPSLSQFLKNFINGFLLF